MNVFLQTKINQPGFTCADMNTVFFPCGRNNIQLLFDQLPGMQFSDQLSNSPPLYKNTNPGFAGLEQAINGAKGYVRVVTLCSTIIRLMAFQMFDQTVNPPQSYFLNGRVNKGTQMQINTIQDFIMLFEVMNDSQFKQMFDVTNDRIYKAMQTVDANITKNGYMKSDGSGPIAADWASSYKSWMTGYLTTIAGDAWAWVSKTVTDLETELTGKTDSVSVAQLNSLNLIKGYPHYAEAYFTIDFGLSWSTGTLSTRDLVKRAGAAGAACAYTPSGGSSATSGASSASSGSAGTSNTGSNSGTQSGRPSITSSPATTSGTTTGASGTSSNTISGPSSVPARTTTGTGTGTKPATTTAAPSNTLWCMADGAPWYSPTSWCDCGASASLPALPVPTGITGTDSSSAMCTYSSIDPAKTIHPVSTSAAPTNIPGEGGLDGCRGVIGPDSNCPYAEYGYCNCNEVYVPNLNTVGSMINCDYTLQPTANKCPVVTAFSSSIAAASASAASVESVSRASAASVMSASSQAALPTGSKYTVYFTYESDTTVEEFADTTDDFWKAWQTENDAPPPDYCSSTDFILNQSVWVGEDVVGYIVYPKGPLKFTVKTDKGKRDCTWNPSGTDSDGFDEGPGSLTCDAPGPTNQACVNLNQPEQACGSALYSVTPLLSCSWQDQD